MSTAEALLCSTPETPSCSGNGRGLAMMSLFRTMRLGRVPACPGPRGPDGQQVGRPAASFPWAPHATLGESWSVPQPGL